MQDKSEKAPESDVTKTLSQLAEVRAIFQQRAIVTHLGGNPDAIPAPKDSGG